MDERDRDLLRRAGYKVGSHLPSDHVTVTTYLKELGISHALIEQMTKENQITRQDMWDHVQRHKDKTKDEFGGWLVGQEIKRTDKTIMAVDLWNDIVKRKLEEKGGE